VTAGRQHCINDLCRAERLAVRIPECSQDQPPKLSLPEQVHVLDDAFVGDVVDDDDGRVQET